MKVIPKLQQGNTIESDNTKVVRPEIHEPIKAKPRQYSIVDLGGEPSNDTRSAAERNRDYWHPIKGAKARFKASMSNETNPLVGIERTILPSAAGAALVTTPAAVVGGALGNMTVDKLTGAGVTGWKIKLAFRPKLEFILIQELGMVVLKDIRLERTS